MSDTEKLSMFQAVNDCETLEELSQVILDFADDNGMIQGMTRKFNASIMAADCLDFKNLPANCLTRKFGIRQQAMYIIYYNQ